VSAAFKTIANSSPPEALTKLVDESKLNKFLLSKDYKSREAGGDAGFEALRQLRGRWTINTDGACPGTDCASGGAMTGGQFTPVPGGRTCSLCRYWVTGPAFLLGQVAEFNSRTYLLRTRHLEMRAVREALVDAEDAGDRSRARALRDKVELMTKSLEIDTNDWVARYQYIIESEALLDEYIQETSNEGEPRPGSARLVTKSPSPEFRTTLQESSQFMLLEWVTQMGEFMPAFKCREAIFEKREMLSKLLAHNGIEQFFLKLPEDRAEVAANLMSDLFYKAVRAAAIGSSDGLSTANADAQRKTDELIQDLLDGNKKLSSVPGLKQAVQKLAHQAELFDVNELQRLS
jgi:hypothetical protein